MARPFSADEKDRIFMNLKAAGRKLFTRYGLKKTAVGDLTRQVGIAQGSFYQFYSSKEALYFSILEDEEVRIKALLTGFLPSDRPLKAGDLEAMMIAGYEEAKATPLMMQLISGEAYQEMVARLPAEVLAQHTRQDEDHLLAFVTKWQREGTMIREDPKRITGVLRALFLITLHERELGQEQSLEIFRLMVRLIAKGLCIEAESEKEVGGVQDAVMKRGAKE